MSDLTWTLLAIAAVLLAALYLYGKWQERKAAREFDDLASDDERASAMARVSTERSSRHAPLRIEPTIGTIGADPPAAHAAADDAPAESDEEPVAASIGGWVEDPLLDLMLELRCVHSFDGVAALEARAQLDRLASNLPIHLAVWDTRAARWSLPDRFGFYSEMLIAVQLATRRHSLGDIEAARFIAAVQQIAVAIDADFDTPDVARIVQQAIELDRLCARFDVQITLTLEAQAEAWSAALIDSAAGSAQFLQVEPGRWERSDALDSPALYMTAAPTGELSTRLAMTLDVPQARNESAALASLFSTARQLAEALHARLVDDNGRPVEPGAQATIEGELETLVREMRAAGIEPGSTRARRLYTG